VTRIICIGSAYDARDAAGPLVHERLARRPRAPGVDLIDGGLAGLDLVRVVEGARRVVFVDAVDGPAPLGGEVLTLDPQEVAAYATGAFDHSAGLPYLLRVLPIVLDTPMPEVSIVAVRGVASSDTLDRAAALALQLATEATVTSAGQGA
jgi:hydrogenase maturation protease